MLLKEMGDEKLFKVTIEIECYATSAEDAAELTMEDLRTRDELFLLVEDPKGREHGVYFDGVSFQSQG